MEDRLRSTLVGLAGEARRAFDRAQEHGSAEEFVQAIERLEASRRLLEIDKVDERLRGHVKGAFTNAINDRDGIFAKADGGTVFVDEIGELELEPQPALLRALDKRTVCKLGATAHHKFDARVVAATNRDLRAEVATRRFREDLYYRLAVIRIAVPALRERGSDIPRLVEYFANRFAPGIAISPDDMQRLLAHGRRGNVRELRNVMERACLLARGGALDLDGALAADLPIAASTTRHDEFLSAP